MLFSCRCVVGPSIGSQLILKRTGRWPKCVSVSSYRQVQDYVCALVMTEVLKKNEEYSIILISN